MSTSGYLSGRTLGRYRVGPLLGRGGMGEVYRADDTELRRPVAIKVLPESLTADGDRLARFIQEARTASALNHPHLVSIYEIGEARLEESGAAVHFIAMELVAGDTLRQVLESKRTNLKRTLDYLAQAADALAAAHGAGIVHRDLKPDNIMIAEGGYAKVLDFGLAKLRGERAAAFGSDATVTSPVVADAPGTSPGVVMGTVGYMSPEQAQGLAADHRSDVFSFGCILYEAASGTRPFSGSSAVDTLHKIIHTQPPAITQFAPSCPPELQRMVRKCLAKSPDERYQSMKDLALDLRDLRRELDSGAISSVTAAAPRRDARSWRPRAAAALLVLAAIAAGAWLLQRNRAAAPAVEATIERITASGLVTDAVISGDGKYVAYVESSGGRQALWLRQTRGGRPLQLVASDGGFWGIVFSRDATSVYYAIKSRKDPLGALYAIPALGGTPRPLLTGIDSAVTFSPDGSQLAYLRVEAAEEGASSLMIAGANGENPHPLVTKRAPEFLAPGFYVAPSWSPDGTVISAALRNSQTRTTRVSLFAVNGGKEEVLPHEYLDATFTQWLPDGSGIIVVGRARGVYSTGNGGQLWLQPYPSGPVQRVTRDILEYRTASLPADGKSLLSVTFEVAGRLSVRPLAGGEERLLREDRSAGATGVAWAPDGRHVFYVKGVAGELQLWTMAADGTNAQDIIHDVAPSGVAVSGDGKWLIFGAERNGKSGIWRAGIDGTNPRLLAEVSEAWALSLSSDSKEVYFASRRDGSPATYRVSSDGGQPQLVSRLFDRAVPSPDGRMLAGVYKARSDAPFVIGILNAADGTAVATLPDASPSTGNGGFAWLPDGKTLLYTTSERTNIWRQPVTGGKPENVTNFSDLWVLRWALSPDAKNLLLFRANVSRDALLLTNFK